MPIDYSHHEWRTLFANYGLTAHAAQMLEKTLLLLWAGVHCRKERKRVPSDLHAFLEQHKRNPVGEIIKALKQQSPFPPDLATDLRKVFKQRNDVIHHFFFDSFDGRNWATPPEQMDRELRPRRSVSRAAIQSRRTICARAPVKLSENATLTRAHVQRTLAACRRELFDRRLRRIVHLAHEQKIQNRRLRSNPQFHRHVARMSAA